jgi:4-amino-4-deoxy-L-arabinose transferase-like glycosyltransferase
MKRTALWLFILALAIRCLVIIATQQDGLYGQDAFAYAGCAREIVHMHAGAYPCAAFYWPLGYPLLASLFMLLLAGARGAQMASVILGAAVVPLTYWLAMAAELPEKLRRNQRRIAVTAGVIVLFCGQLTLSSVVVMSDAPGLCWATLAMCLLLHWERRAGTQRNGHTWLILAALALGTATITRWIYGGLLLPCCVFVLFGAHRQSGKRTNRTWYLAVGLVVLPFLVIVVPQLYVSALVGAPALGHSWVVNWSPMNSLLRSFDTPDGHADVFLPPLIFYAAPLFYPIYLSPLLTPLVFFGVWHLRRSKVLLLLGGWALVLYLYLSGVPFENLRFGLAFFVPIAVLAAVGLYCIPLPALKRKAAAGARESQAVSVEWIDPALRSRWVLLAVALSLTVPLSYRALVKFNSAQQLSVAAMRYLESRVPADATVVTFELSIALEYYTRFKVVDLYVNSPKTLGPLVCCGNSAYLYVNEARLEAQWLGKSPAENFHWLRDRVGIQEIGRYGIWTLYRVAHCSP